MLRQPSIRRIAVLAFAMALSLCIAGAPTAAASATLAQEEHQGEGIAASVRAGEKQCSDLSADEFELIGEYAMGRYLGSEASHTAMNRRMTQMMGEDGERRMHVALGHRYSGCADGPASGWVGPLAGMMGGAYGEGMMNVSRSEERGNYPGTMMGARGHGDGDLSTLGIVLVALAAAALGAGAATLFSRRRPPRDGAAAS